MIPEVAMNPLAARLVAMFERDAEDRVNFKGFAMGLAVFNERAPAEAKARGEQQAEGGRPAQLATT
jgi:hypothetical protein